MANLRALWPLLRHSDRPRIHKLSDHIHTIVLPQELNLKWPFGDNVGNLLFVRPSQQWALHCIMKRFIDMMIEGNQLFIDHPGFIVKGSPGIGKSTYATV